MTDDTTVIDLPDLTELCRVCLELPDEDNCLDLAIIYDEDDNLTYAECFTICTNVNISQGVNLPHSLCKTCGLELQVTYDFMKKVEESKRSLQQYNKQVEEATNETYWDGGEETKKLQYEHETLMNASDFVITHGEDDQQTTTTDIIESGNVVQILNVEGGYRQCKVASNATTIKSERIIDDDLLDEEGEDNDGGHANTCTEDSLTQTDDNLVLEEHLDADEFNNEEALDDEETELDAPQTTKSHSSIPILVEVESSEKYFFEENIENDTIHYRKTTIKDASEAIDEDTQEEPLEDKGDCRSWQQNVVAVANKEHLPLESESEETTRVGNNEEFDYDMLQCGSTGGDDDLVVQLHKEIEAEVDDGDDDGGSSAVGGGVLQSRKRHVGSYSCDICHKVYPNYSRMMTHRRCHEADRPKYPCNYCSRIYATKQAMECHVQTFHDKTGFACETCNKVFAIRRSLQVHMRFHTRDFPYACDLCDKKFAQIGHLNTHKNIKHNNIRFGCDYPDCGKFFTSSTSLRNHEFSHGVMPFECHYCQRGYPAKSKLKIHAKRKHGMDLSKEELEDMRKFHVMRSKVNLVKVVPLEQEDEA